MVIGFLLITNYQSPVTVFILNMKKILTVCCAGGLIVVLTLCTVTTVESAAAVVTAFPARKQLDNWRDKQRPLEHAQWESVRYQIDHALQYTPDDPGLLSDLGLAQEAEFILYPANDRAARAGREKAGKYYQQSILLRPSWPYDRINLMLVKYRLDGTDRNLFKLMAQASELGPWEPRVQQVVAEIGLRHWNSLPDDMKTVVLETVNNGVLHSDNTTGMLNLLRRYDMPELVCDRQYENEQVVKFCEKY